MFNFLKNLFTDTTTVIVNTDNNSAFFQGKNLNECSQRTIEIKEQIKKIEKEISDNVSEQRKIEYEKVAKKNNICPKCQHDKSISKFIKQEADGSISGSSWKALSFGESSISGSFKSDTKPVNRCTKCDHEWLIEEVKYNEYNTEDFKIRCKISILFDVIKEQNLISACTFNPNDIKEKFNSLDEKKKELIEKFERNKRWCKNVWNGQYIETILEISKAVSEYKYNDSVCNLLHNKQYREIFEKEIGIIY